MKKRFFFACAYLVLLGSISQAQTAIPNYVTQNGLVGWWPFGNNANDQSGRNNHGIANGATLTTDRGGNPNSAYGFNGYSNSIEVPDAPSLRVRKLTMSVWVYSTNLDPGLYDAAIYKGRRNDASGEAYSLSMEMSSAVKIGSGCQSGNGWRRGYFGGQRIPRNAWTHLCTTFDGSYLRNYINSVEIEALHVTGLIDSCTGGNLRFGYAHDLFGRMWAWPFAGKLDDIGIWNRALYQGEILELYKGAPIAAPVIDSSITGPSSIAQVYSYQVTLAPNPAKEAIVLKRTPTGERLQVTVSDLMGRVMLRVPFINETQQIGLNDLTSGLYLVTVTNTKGVPLFREKLVVE